MTLLSAPSTTNGGRANLTVWAAKLEAGSIAADLASATSIYAGAAAYSSLLAGKQLGTVLSLFERDNDPYVPRNLTLASFAVPQGAEKLTAEPPPRGAPEATPPTITPPAKTPKTPPTKTPPTMTPPLKRRFQQLRRRQ